MASPLTSNTSLIEHATAILQAATQLQQRLDAEGLPQPSLDVDSGGRRDWHDASQHADILQARSALIDASRAILHLALGPVDALVTLTVPDMTRLEVVRTLDALGVAQAVPLRGHIALAQLADELGVDAAPLYRYLRFAYLSGLFCEPREGFVAHTAMSAELPGLAPYLRLRTSPLLTGGVEHIPEALASRGVDGAKVKIARELADANKRSFWTIVEEDYPPGEGMRFFSAGMKSIMVGLLGESLSPYVHGLDWASLGGGTVVDVGGGNGHVEVTVLPQIPSDINFIIQDLPANQEPARALIEQHSAHERISFQPHDFFRPQPTDLHPPPKAYLLSRVLHDWRDDECMTILRQLVPAMETHGTRLWLCERVLPDRTGQMPNHVEQQLRAADLLMFKLYGGSERTLADWMSVFTKADSRLRVAVLKQPLDSVLSFIEVVLGGDEM